MDQLKAFCELPFNQVKINSAGEVHSCCYQAGDFGNVLTTPFEDIWLGVIAESIRNRVSSGRLPAICSSAGTCPYLVNPRNSAPIALTEDRYPTSLQLDLPNTHCNVGGSEPTPQSACIMCPRSSADFESSPDRIDEILDRVSFLMPRLKKLRVQGVAEPFWKGRVFEVLERLHFGRYRDSCHFTTFTNGTVFNQAARSRYVELCPNSTLFFSLDAATPETYRNIRRLDAFELVLSNIRAFAEQKLPTQKIVVANNINMLNVAEAEQMVEIASAVGADEVIFNPTDGAKGERTNLHSFLVNRDNAGVFKQAESRIREKAETIGFKALFFRPLSLQW